MCNVYCFSGSGHSRAVAAFLAEKLGAAVQDTEGAELSSAAPCAVVFPVYCQGVPAPVKAFFAALRAEQVALVAVHGGVSYGRTLYEAKKMVRGRVVAGAYVRTGHTYLREGNAFDGAALLPLVQRLKLLRDGDAFTEVHIPATRKNPFAAFAPAWRSRLGVRLLRGDACNGCNVCGGACPVHAMRQGKAGGGCIRCLRCVQACPRGALSFRLRPVLHRYLARRRTAQTVLYL